MMTFCAPSSIIATSSASEPTFVRVNDCFSPSPPKDLNSTSMSLRFIALHMMNVNMRPEAPTREPAIMSTELPMMNPVNAAAIPERELSKDTTTGISAPPIGRTSMIPRIHEIPMIPQRYCSFVGSSILAIMRAMTPRNKSTLTGLSHVGPQVGVRIHFPKTSTPPLSLYIAKSEPVSVIHPTRAERPAATMVTVISRPVGIPDGSAMYF